ncbi:MAG TPA: UDP-N-acetylmuramoyl-L-alanine--D-glutamate ligase [Lachnospiraceae bacterium]|nr:UDP-N-acetylmuramoyl-L-alanine--D-glutamate ligase [Lachnospiraceae bacterium]
MILKDKNVLVVGSGKSGVAAVRLLREVCAYPVLFDSNEKLSTEELHDKLEDHGTTPVFVSTLPKEVEEGIDIVVLSPGVPVDLPFVEAFSKRSIPIIGEIELGYLVEKGKVVAITGTNGKTTTTTLVGEIMKADYEQVFVVGNIGNPYTLEVMKTSSKSLTVAEVSSFQLETAKSFHPTVSAILNITPDHLNRHHTMENYVTVKESIAKNQTKENVCVLNYEDGYLRDYAENCPAKVVFFSSVHILENGFFFQGDTIYRAKDGKMNAILNVNTDMSLVGQCNIENVMAALAIAESMNVPLEVTLKVIKRFRAVEHRIEFVAEKGGVVYYNDSKGTNPDAAIQGIRAMSRKTVLIGGGYDKGSEFDDWIAAFGDKVKCLVLLGQTKDKIAECARKHGFTNIKMADTFDEAFSICVETAKSGDAVLLSPACASWGMFPNFEERGRIFKELVNTLKE